MSKRILVVDDGSMQDLILFLTDAGFKVVGLAKDGERAIELAYEQRPDLILMNIELPKLNGLKASDIIHKAYRIPSLLVSSSSQKEYVEEMKKPHIMGYLVKPISEVNLISAVEIALVQAQNQKLYEEKIMALDLSLQQRKSIEKAKGIIMRKRKITEEKAYRLLRKLSMNKHLPMAKIAELIIVKDQPPMLKTSE